VQTTPHGKPAPQSFEELFGRPPEIVAEAPGRVNLIGEHTDYNGGFVLPIAVPQRARVELAPRPDKLVRAYSANLIDEGIASFELGSEARTGGWIDYAQGVTRAFAQGCASLVGFDLRVASEVPLGAGLSSSAALTVALLRALCQAFAHDLSAVEIAALARRAENELVGAPVGIMDPMAASLASERTALFIDTRSLVYKPIPLPEGVELVVLDSGISHQNAVGKYRERRAECERAAAELGLRELRDMRMPELRRRASLPEPLSRRVRHVITENARVMATVTALREHDFERVGELFEASQRSMREDYEITTPEIDALVEIARTDADVFGARMTGGGFGGAVVALAREGAGAGAAQRITSTYAARTGHAATVLLPGPRAVDLPRAPSIPPQAVDDGWSL